MERTNLEKISLENLTQKELKLLVFTLEDYANPINWDLRECLCLNRDKATWSGFGRGPEKAQDILNLLKKIRK